MDNSDEGFSDLDAEGSDGWETEEGSDPGEEVDVSVAQARFAACSAAIALAVEDAFTNLPPSLAFHAAGILGATEDDYGVDDDTDLMPALLGLRS